MVAVVSHTMVADTKDWAVDTVDTIGRKLGRTLKQTLKVAYVAARGNPYITCNCRRRRQKL